MGIWLVLKLLPEWIALVVGLFPGLAEVYAEIWYGETDPEIDAELPR